MAIHRVHVIASSIAVAVLGIVGIAMWHHHHTHPAQPPPPPVIENVPLQPIAEGQTTYLPVDTARPLKNDPQKIVDAIADFQKNNSSAVVTSVNILDHGILITWKCKCQC